MAGTSPKLIVGLGNPGANYRDTPHNIGFQVVEELTRRCGVRLGGEGFVRAAAAEIRTHSVVLVQPQTFMNNSGAGIAAVMKSRLLTHRDLIVVHDEMDLPWTGLRIKRSGSAAGHNGVKSIIAALKTDSFVRVRVGVRPEHPIEDTAAYVLDKFEPGMKTDLEEMVHYAALAIEAIVAEGAVQAMAKFNRRAQGLEEVS